MMKSILSYIWGWLFIIVAVVFSVQTTALDPSFYTTRYEKMNLAEELHISSEDLNSGITLLLDYLEGKEESLEREVVINGKKQPIFNEREISHMVDVRELYRNAIKTAIFSAIGMAVILFWFLMVDKVNTPAFLTRGFLQALLCMMLALTLLGIWVLTDFTGFWMWFHTLFFNNDLWLLNPATDFMINMLPETIFYQLVLTIVLKVVFILIPCAIFSIWYQRKKAPIGFGVKK